MAKIPLINSYEAILLSLYSLPSWFSLICPITTDGMDSALVRIQVSVFLPYFGMLSNFFSILICLHSFAIKWYRHPNMKKKLFRVKTVISLSCRNECIFLRSQFFYSLFLVLLERIYFVLCCILLSLPATNIGKIT